MSRTLALKTVEVAKRYLNVREDGESRGDEVELFQKMVSLVPNVPDEVKVIVMNITEPGRLADFVSAKRATICRIVSGRK